jgi:antirestriction protein ArdC
MAKWKPGAKSRDMYQEITDKIVAELEAGTAPWVKPWRSTAGLNTAMNITTKRPYSGVNVLIIMMAMAANGWVKPHFISFKQAKEAGGTVRGGEKATMICFTKKIIGKDKNDPDKEKVFGILKTFPVFNVAQCDNLPAKYTDPEPAKPLNSDERDTLIDEFVATTKADIREGFGEAFFRPSGDFISMPSFESFKSGDHFNATRFHELAHWTGHTPRLDRKFGQRFGDQSYAAEELVAELTSAFLCAEFDIDGDLRHAGYLATWLKLLKSDPKAIFTASAAAQKAADFLRGLALQDETEATDSEASEESEIAQAA